MRKSYLSAAALAVLAMLLSTPALAQSNAREILDKAIQKLGGAAYREVKDIEAHGRFFQFQRGQMVGGEFYTDYLKFPDKERTEFGKKGKTVRINNGDKGWNVQDKEVEAQIEDQVEVFWEEFKVSLDYILRIVVDEEETTVQFVGREMLDFKRVDILELRNEDRTRINLYIERDSGLLVKKTVRRLDDPSVHEEIYSNYHLIQDVLTPLLITRYTDGAKTMELRMSEVIYNTGVSDLLFSATIKN
jgi:outer membrane lipoprotein-sorting protein